VDAAYAADGCAGHRLRDGDGVRQFAGSAAIPRRHIDGAGDGERAVRFFADGERNVDGSVMSELLKSIAF